VGRQGPNYCSVTVWDAHGENCARYLTKGRLDWREWTGQDGTKRESVEIVAGSIQFLGGRDDADANCDTDADCRPGAGPRRGAILDEWPTEVL